MKPAVSLALLAALAAASPAPVLAQAAPKPVDSSGVCDLFLVGTGSNISAVVEKLSSEIAKRGCKAGDILRIVTDGGLPYNISAEQVCDFRYSIVTRPGGLASISCIYVGTVRPFRSEK